MHKEPPPFEPVFIRGMENLAHDEDIITKFYGSYLKKNLLQGVARGASSDESSTSFVPSLARGVDFGNPGHMVHTANSRNTFDTLLIDPVADAARTAP